MTEAAGLFPEADDELIGGIARRYGFKARDFSVIWDGGAFDPARVIHDVRIEAADGRHSSLQISQAHLERRDRWKYVRQVEVAFAALARRDAPRGE